MRASSSFLVVLLTMRYVTASILASSLFLARGFSPLLNSPVNPLAKAVGVAREQTIDEGTLDDKQADFCRGYLNKHHSDVLCLFAEAYSEIGAEMSGKNAFSGGSFKIVQSKVTDVSAERLDMEVTVQERSRPEPTVRTVSIQLDSDFVYKRREFQSLPPIPDMPRTAVDNLVRRLVRLCNQVNRPDVTGKLTQMGIQFGSSVGYLKENLYLNQVPHNRYVRQYFYDMAASAAVEAVILCSDKKLTNRMKMVATFPELNSSMDSYRYVPVASFGELYR